MTTKETWFIVIERDGKKGIGECGLLRGLSSDDRPDYEAKLRWACDNIELGKDVLWEALLEFPSIQFGIETAFLSIHSNDPFLPIQSDFTRGIESIPINGLVWMGDEDFMRRQIDEKLTEGFTCIKLKIGALKFDAELKILEFIRSKYSASDIEIRVDANGGFSSSDAFDKLTKLSEFEIHSIEQPIAKMQSDRMAALCRNTPVPIALDEELIGITTYAQKDKLLDEIRPQYIILKPSFIGGIRGSLEWITLAEMYNIGWWVTSALESNIGLNAIAQWTYTLKNRMPQGLGTGSLFTNNIDSPLFVRDGALHYDKNVHWNLPEPLRL